MRKIFFVNFFSHNIINVVNIIVPLITYPYIIRTLGLNSYGECAFLISYFGVITILCEFAFSLTGTKKLARVRNSSERNLIISQVVNAKLYIFSIVTPIAIFLLIFLGKSNLLFLFICSLIPLCEVFNFTWVYISISKTKIAAFSVLTGRVLSIPLLFFFVNSEQDAINYMLVYVLSLICICIFQIIHLIMKEKLVLKVLKCRHVIKIIRDGRSLFLGRITSSLKDRYIAIWLGFFSSNEMVAIYDVINKIISLAMNPIYSFSTILFPLITGRNGIKINLSKFILLGFVFISSIILIVSPYSKYVLFYFGGYDLEQYTNSFNKFLFAMPMLYVSSIIGTCFLVVNSFYKSFNLSIVFSFLVLVILSMLIYVFDSVTIESLSYVFLISILMEFLTRIIKYFRECK